MSTADILLPFLIITYYNDHRPYSYGTIILLMPELSKNPFNFIYRIKSTNTKIVRI